MMVGKRWGLFDAYVLNDILKPDNNLLAQIESRNCDDKTD